MVKKWLLLILLFGFFAGCAAAGSNPASTEQASDFSSRRYLVATGIGQSDAEARRMAKAEMSAIFESKIDSQVGSSVKLVTDSKEGEDINKKTEANINIRSNVQLQGVEIKKTWYDEKSHMYYAQAVLDKYAAREHWSDRLAKLDEDIDAGFERLKTIKSPVFKIESLKILYHRLIEKDTVESKLRVIGFFDQGFSEYNADSTMGMIRDVKAMVLIHIDISGNHAKEVEAIISERLSEKGYKLTPGKEDAAVLMTGTVKTEPVVLDNDQWKFSRAVVSLTVSDVLTHRDILKIHKSVRKGHMDASEASRKAALSAGQKTSEEIIEYFGI
jgi:LPP20 lipoprotein